MEFIRLLVGETACILKCVQCLEIMKCSSGDIVEAAGCIQNLNQGSELP